MYAHAKPVVVRAGGDIDYDTAPALRRTLAAELGKHREVVLDLSQVTFMDCAGLSAVVHAHGQADRRGGRLVLRGAGPPVIRLLKLTGLDHCLTVDP